MNAAPPPPPGQRLPHDVEAELGLLGAVMLDAPRAVELAGNLEPEAFALLEHGALWRAMRALVAEGSPVTPVTLRHALAGSAVFVNGELDDLIVRATGAAVTAGNSRTYADAIRDYHRRRRFEELGRRLTQESLAGGDISGVLAEIGEADAGKGGELRAVRADLLTVCTEPDLIAGVLPADGLALIVGASGSGKSFAAIDLGMAVARGIPWRGRAVLQGAVLYIAAEGGRRFKNRVEAYRRHHGCADAAPFYVVKGSVNLLTGASVPTIIAEARRIASETGVPLRIVVIDTLNRSMPGGDENNPQDMGSVIANLERIAAATGGTVAVVHHLGKDATRGARGHSSLFAAADGELTIAKGDDGAGSVTVTKSRDGETGERFGFELLAIGDGPGECVAVEAKAPERTRRVRLTPAARVAFDALCNAINLDGEIPPKSRHLPEHVRCVRLDVWREYCGRVQITAASTADAKRMAFKRSAEILQSLGLIGVYGDWVWMANKRT